MENVKNAIIIGSGPAGYSAAIYLARAGLKPLLLAGDKFGGQLMYTSEVENYPGLGEGVLGPKLMMDMKSQAEKFETKIVNKKADKVDFSKKPFEIYCGKEKFLGRSVVIATGAEAIRLNLINEKKFYGKGISACAVCDGAFFRNKKVFVVGGGDSACEDALVLTKFAEEVILLVRRKELRASQIMQKRVKENEKIEIWWESEVKQIMGREKLEKIKIAEKNGNEKIETADGLFYAIGHKPMTKIFDKQIRKDKKGYVLTNLNGLDKNADMHKIWLNKFPTITSVEGVFACGDVVDFRYRQAVTAAGMGVMAALDLEKWLKEI